MKNHLLYQELIKLRKDFTDKRIEFLNSILRDQNVRIEVKPFRDKISFEKKFREIIQKPTEYEQSINHLINKCFQGRLPDQLEKFYEDLKTLRSGTVPNGYDGYFKNCIYKLDESQFDKLMVLIPEDLLYAEYKANDTAPFKSISNASAGQKTASILTFILSYGEYPLLLDQPEDDLDNHLVYG